MKNRTPAEDLNFFWDLSFTFQAFVWACHIFICNVIYLDITNKVVFLS